MSKGTLFIDEALIKERSTLNNNVDPKLIIPAIKYCQDVYLEPTLGTELFLELQGKISLGGNTLTADERDLLDNYIMDVLIMYTLSEMPMMLGYKFYNKNVLKNESENATQAQLYELQTLSDWYKNKAEYYENRLIKYLQEDSSQGDSAKFPKYCGTVSRLDYIEPKKRGFSSAFYLGNAYDRRRGKSFEENNQD